MFLCSLIDLQPKRLNRSGRMIAHFVHLITCCGLLVCMTLTFSRSRNYSMSNVILGVLWSCNRPVTYIFRLYVDINGCCIGRVSGYNLCAKNVWHRKITEILKVKILAFFVLSRTYSLHRLLHWGVLWLIMFYYGPPMNRLYNDLECPQGREDLQGHRFFCCVCV